MPLVARAKSIVRARPEIVFDAFVNPDKMKQFWFHRKDAGLEPNEVVTWYIGDDDEALGFDVHVIDLKPHSLIHVSWDEEEGPTEVRWVLEETEEQETILTIEETGFSGSDEEIVAQALDSTGGFNQVIIAAKAFIDHGVAINVVSDHA